MTAMQRTNSMLYTVRSMPWIRGNLLLQYSCVRKSVNNLVKELVMEGLYEPGLGLLIDQEMRDGCKKMVCSVRYGRYSMTNGYKLEDVTPFVEEGAESEMLCLLAGDGRYEYCMKPASTVDEHLTEMCEKLELKTYGLFIFKRQQYMHVVFISMLQGLCARKRCEAASLLVGRYLSMPMFSGYAKLKMINENARSNYYKRIGTMIMAEKVYVRWSPDFGIPQPRVYAEFFFTSYFLGCVISGGRYGTIDHLKVVRTNYKASFFHPTMDMKLPTLMVVGANPLNSAGFKLIYVGVNIELPVERGMDKSVYRQIMWDMQSKDREAGGPTLTCVARR